MIEFKKWPKIPRFEKLEYIITEKIDGAIRTNNTIRLFEAKHTLNKCLRELKEFVFDSSNYYDRTIWVPKYKQLLDSIEE